MVLFDGSDDPICDLGLVPSPRFCAKLRRAGQHGRGDQLFKREKSEMNASTVAVDLAKNVFQLAAACSDWHRAHAGSMMAQATIEPNSVASALA